MWVARAVGRVVPPVRVDDVADEPVPYDVTARQPAEVHVVDVVQDVLHDVQAAACLRRQVDLRHVAGDHHLRAETQARQEHLHLLGRGVLRLVEDDERVVERAAAHVRQRRHLDGPLGHEPRDRVRVEHVVQRVVERPQVWVDLLVQSARQEAEPLPRLDGRPREDDPPHLLGLQRLHGLGDGEVRLAGAGRADAEHDGVVVDRVDVPLLVERLGPDRAAAVGEDVQRQHVGRALGARAGRPQHGGDALDGLGCQPLAGADHGDELVHHLLAEGDGLGRTGDRDLVAADVDVGVEGLLQRA